MIKIVKLVSGEELIGDTDQNHIGITIKKPCILQMVQSRQDPTQPMMSLIPYAFYAEDHTVTIDPSKVVWSEKPITELYNQYNSIFGTGIQLASV